MTLAGVAVAAFAAWYAMMPWCDVSDVEVVSDDTGVKLKCTVRDTGRGQALRVDLTLLEYGGLRQLPHSTFYLGPLGAGESKPFESHRVELEGRTPISKDFRALLKWTTLLGIYGESYVNTQPDPRPRVRIIDPVTALWRRVTHYQEA